MYKYYKLLVRAQRNEQQLVQRSHHERTKPSVVFHFNLCTRFEHKDFLSHVTLRYITERSCVALKANRKLRFMYNTKGSQKNVNDSGHRLQTLRFPQRFKSSNLSGITADLREYR